MKEDYNSFIIVYKAHVTVHSVHKTEIVASEQSNKYQFQSLLKKHAFDIIIMEDTKMIKAGIIGATGYAGNEIVRILLGHKNVEVVWYGSRSYIDQKYAGIY